MKRIQIKNISQIPFEGTHALPNTRQTLATKDDLVTDNIDALTKGTLSPDQIWDWHQHDEHDEICIVLQGRGNFVWQDETHQYGPEDIMIIPAGNRHKIEAKGHENSEFYFVRIKV